MTKEMEGRIKISINIAREAMIKAGSVLESLLDLIEAAEDREAEDERDRKGR